MTNARDRGWGDPDRRGYRTDHIIKIEAGGQVLYVRREVAPLFQAFLNELVATGYRLDGQDDDWGYINRDIRGRPGVKSNHSWGLAVDINAAKNPMGPRLVTDLPAGVSAMAKRYGLTWGGDYRGRKDAMHFEYEGTPNDAVKLAARLAAPEDDMFDQPDKDKLNATHWLATQANDRVGRIEALLEEQTRLLEAIAEKHGVD